jgi:hypothetical protein
MWELQPLSTNRRTTEISLLLGENTSLTISQIPHNFVGLLSFTLSSCSLVSLFWCDIYGKDALPIYRQASLPLSCKRQEQGKWHQLVLQVAPNWCPFCWLSCTNWCQLASHMSGSNCQWAYSWGKVQHHGISLEKESSPYGLSIGEELNSHGYQPNTSLILLLLQSYRYIQNLSKPTIFLFY